MENKIVFSSVKRVRWLDVAKGLAIVLVVLGHVASPLADSNDLAKFVLDFTYTMHMPVFFYLAGLTSTRFSKKKLGILKQIRSKFIRLMLPYFTFSLINGCLIYGGAAIPKFKPILYKGDFPGPFRFVMGILFQVNNIDTHLWFAYYLFVYCAFSIFLQTFRNSKKMYNISFVLVVLATVLILPNMSEFYLSDVISKYIFWSGYYLAGCIHLHEKIHIDTPIKSGIYAGIVLNVLYAYFLEDIHSYTMVYWSLRTVVGYTSIAFMILISKCVVKYMGDSIISKIEYIGRRSFSVYILHQPFITSAFVMLFSGIFRNKYIIIMVLATTLSVAIPLLIEKNVQVTWVRMILFGEINIKAQESSGQK